MGMGDWGVGMGDWGWGNVVWGVGPNAQPPIPMDRPANTRV